MHRYLSGLTISENKTVDGINRLFVIESRHQSNLNHRLTAGLFSEAVLNRQRLALLNSLEGTRVKPKGVVSLRRSNPRKWRQNLPGVLSRNQGKPEVAALNQNKLLIARQLLCRWVGENAPSKTARHVRQLACSTRLLPFSRPRAGTALHGHFG